MVESLLKEDESSPSDEVPLPPLCTNCGDHLREGHQCPPELQLEPIRDTVIRPPPPEGYCCPEGGRYQLETGSYSYDHPGDCAVMDDGDRKFLLMVTEMREHISYERMLQLLFQKKLLEPK